MVLIEFLKAEQKSSRKNGPLQEQELPELFLLKGQGTRVRVTRWIFLDCKDDWRHYQGICQGSD